MPFPLAVVHSRNRKQSKFFIDEQVKENAYRTTLLFCCKFLCSLAIFVHWALSLLISFLNSSSLMLSPVGTIVSHIAINSSILLLLVLSLLWQVKVIHLDDRPHKVFILLQSTLLIIYAKTQACPGMPCKLKH